MKKRKCLIYVVAYNHEKFILKTLNRIPSKIYKKYNLEILVSDDFSLDNTLLEAKKFRKKKINIISHFKNQGYGGNQKIGYFYAIKKNFYHVVLLHGDGQYAPEYLPKILKELDNKENDAVFGSRMLSKGSALKGGMPLYKFIGNKILTYIQNLILKANLSEFHSGYRAYKVSALKNILFELNSNDYCFDTEIIIQLILAKFKIKEVSIPTFYGDEISYVNGLKYAFQIVFATLKSKLHFHGIINVLKFSKVNNNKMKKLKKKQQLFLNKIFKKSNYIKL